MTASLIASNLTRTYDGTTVVDGISLTLEPGKITALLGPSGAGKSTLLRLFAGLETPDAGTLKTGETLLASPTETMPAEKRRIGLIFQDFALFPHLTALENIRFGLHTLPKAEARAVASEWLERMGLADRSAAYPHHLSGGEQQRVAIARALAPKPVAVLMDEPFSGLDPALREDVRSTALSAVREAGVPALLVTHDASEAMLSADVLAIMRAGKLVQTGTPEVVYTEPKDAETAAALGPIILLNGIYDTASNTMKTPFGPVPQLNFEKNVRVTIGVRPEAVIIDPESLYKAEVLSTRRDGPLRQLEIQREGLRAFIFAPSTDVSVPGQEIGIKLDPAGCSIFQ